MTAGPCLMWQTKLRRFWFGITTFQHSTGALSHAHNVVTSTLCLLNWPQPRMQGSHVTPRSPFVTTMGNFHNKKPEFWVWLAKNVLVHSPSYGQFADILTESLPWQKTAPRLHKKCLVYSEMHVVAINQCDLRPSLISQYSSGTRCPAYLFLTNYFGCNKQAL